MLNCKWSLQFKNLVASLVVKHSINLVVKHFISHSFSLPSTFEKVLKQPTYGIPNVVVGKMHS